ncbi:restriction endonuclease subunit S [Brachyspira pilosicoli]|uniref:restriction endonuclease subunit S n=1 Tax=Brachyspira pilosicoli TaxID=52584 RepID=UPI000E1700E2|nr:restriction endonuclease subunit S [Brachyspira pilosicoli]SUW04775.1 restriction endonuclease type I S subunit [Brachyspira pilosicoli]
MTASELKKSILQMAVEGKLTEQSEKDEPIEELLKRIKEEKESLIKEGKIKKEKTISEIYKKDGSYYERVSDGKNILKDACIDEELPFEIPDTWQYSYLKNVAFITKLAGFEYTKFIAPNLKSNGIPLFKGKNIQNDSLVLSFDNYIDEELSDELSRSQINKKCLLTPYVGSIGNIAIFDGSFKAHLGSNVGKIEIYNPSDKICILEEFIFLFLQSKSGYQQLTKYKKATAQESISIDAIRNVIIVIPPIEEQKRIVEKINLLMPLINEYDELEKSITKLNKEFPDNIKKSILQYAIEGKLTEQSEKDEPVEELLKRIKEEREKLIKEGKIKKDKTTSEIYKKDGSYYERVFEGDNIVKDVCIDYELPFEIPDSWVWVRLGNIGKIVGGSTPKSENPMYYTSSGNGIPWITPADMKNINGIYISHGRRDITEEGYKSCSTFILPKNSIIFSSRAPIGYVAISNNELCTNQGFKSIVPYISDINFSLLYYYFLQYKTKSIESRASGTTFKEVSGSFLEKELFPLPPIEEQKRIVDKINRVNEVINTIKI